MEAEAEAVEARTFRRKRKREIFPWVEAEAEARNFQMSSLKNDQLNIFKCFGSTYCKVQSIYASFKSDK